MLKVTVELFPYGNAEFKSTLGEMRIANSGSGDERLGDYIYTIDEPKPISGAPIKITGKIVGFKREQSLFALIRDILNNTKSQKLSSKERVLAKEMRGI